MPFRIFLTANLLLLFSVHALASPSDSLESKPKIRTNIYYSFEKDFIYGKVNRFSLDTSVAYVHHVNSALDLQYNFLGTEGSASESQIFHINNSQYTFNSIRSYDLLMLGSDSIMYFHSNKRFTELRYHSGSFKEQRIEILHMQNINKNWNAGLKFDRQGVKDYMNYSNTFRSRFALFTWYSSPEKKYNLFAHAIWTTM